LPPSYDAAVLHDYFVDRLVHTKSLKGLTALLRAKAAEGGGGLHGIEQSEVRGGNAVNLAHALARLGLRVLLITHSDALHESLLRRTFDGLGVEVRVKRLPAGLTVAFEERVNVMLGDVGGAGEFGPSILEEADWEALQTAKVVCSVNWAANRLGTEMLTALRTRLGKKSTIFLDPADFRERVHQFKQLLHLMAERHLADWVSMNEPEGVAAAKALGLRMGSLGEVCRGVARKLGVLFDLHAVGESYTSDGSGVVGMRVHRARSRRLTGAGDVWDAGTIYGRLHGMDDAARLRFANAAALLYLENETPTAPTAEEVLKAVG
jgi:ribokinase